MIKHFIKTLPSISHTLTTMIGSVLRKSKEKKGFGDTFENKLKKLDQTFLLK